MKYYYDLHLKKVPDILITEYRFKVLGRFKDHHNNKWCKEIHQGSTHRKWIQTLPKDQATKFHHQTDVVFDVISDIEKFEQHISTKNEFSRTIFKDFYDWLEKEEKKHLENLKSRHSSTSPRGSTPKSKRIRKSVEELGLQDKFKKYKFDPLDFN